MANKKSNLASRKTSLRSHRQIFTLNDDENKVLERYLTKYRIQNKSKFLRETIMSAVIRRLEEDHPRLFD